MFTKMKQRLRSMETIQSLCTLAEQHALRDQQRQPGAEHFLLAACDLPDGTAQAAFESIGADPFALRAAIDRQYEDALRSIGIDPRGEQLRDSEQPPLPAPAGLYDASASGKQLMQALASERLTHAPLLGAHVVMAVADMEHGVAARALRALGIDRRALKSAADAISKEFKRAV